ncbi:MAG: hypothetical protein H7147_10375 [Frankiaceae bacterium]|nr:hypothetical protein [Arenimonas sp.]
MTPPVTHSALRLSHPKLWIPIALAIGVLAMASANPLLTLGAIVLLALIGMLLWRPGEPPALLFAMGYHWMQASVLVLYANWKGLDMDALGYGAQVQAATWLTFGAILCVALGMRLGARQTYGAVAQPSVLAIASQLSVRRLFAACLAAIVLSTVANRLAYVVPGLVQPILALTLLRWVVVYVFTYAVLSQQRGFRLLAVVFTIEIGIGFLGFFSDFKTVPIVMLLAALAAPASLKGIRRRTVVLLSLVILSLAVLWTGIKTDYRQFLNQGSGQQVVLVPVSERIGKLAELAGNMTPARYGDAVVALVERVSYVYYFGQVMQTVPRDIDYEGGRLWREAVMRTLVPRLLDPDKLIIDDSERTSYYTGNRVAGAEQGASISLGYVAESYIDFGPVLMMAPLFAWGLFVGVLYRLLIRATRFPLLGYGCATVLVALGAAVLEQSNLKMVSAFVLGFLVLFVSQKLFGRRGLQLLAGRR